MAKTQDKIAPAADRPERARFAAPVGLLSGAGALVWLSVAGAFSGGLQSCDYSARFALDDLKFQTVQVVSAFPAFIDPNTNAITRVCGVPLRDDNGDLLPGETDKEPNGVELTVNLVSTDPNARVVKPKCVGEKDYSVKEGDRIESQPLSTSKDLQTVKPGQFKMTLSCYEPHATTSAKNDCAGGGENATLFAKAAYYRREAFGCDAFKPDTAQNVALVVDHSGSVSGFVSMDQKKVADSSKFAEDLPGTVVNTAFKDAASDPFFVLEEGAKLLIEQLNTHDRVVSLGFDETNQVYAACATNLVCQQDDGNAVENSTCLLDTDCAKKHGPGLKCAAHPSLEKDPILPLPLTDGLKYCYGSAQKTKLYNKYGLDLKAKYSANGRAPVYESLVSAYDFLRTAGPGAPDPIRGGNAKHMVLLTDGPDTCTANDNFLYTTFDQFSGNVTKAGGQCRQPCKFSTVNYKELLKKMAQDRFPIHIHVIQIQSLGKLAPDPTLQELACRSQGTYQFLNTADFNRSDASTWQETMTRAILKVRYALAGQWRAGFQDNGFKDGGAVKRGLMWAARGRLTINNALFASLGQVFESGFEKEWRFELLDGGRDARLTFRLACQSDADCGGGKECATSSCGPDGLCRTANAPDLSPCGEAGKSKCCKGACDAKCDGVCK
ncbi:MAG: hypothetical protein FJ100_02520 [Deltaproteobacteria bacterium]|nr:hypothetical protein [Deltaproteobacteria bacterium]